MLSNPQHESMSFEGREITIQTGVLAKQAHGSITLHCGDLVLLAAATMSKEAKSGIDFLPLTVEYSEKMYASGKIPGGFFKREGRPTIDATLNSRLIDRPLRPRFPKGFHNEIQVVVTVLSYDPSFSAEGLSILAASAALSVSDIPFNGPVSAALVAYVDGKYVTNPSREQSKAAELEIVVAGTEDAVLMVEAGATEVSEEIVLGAIEHAKGFIKASVEIQKQLAAKVGKGKQPDPVIETDAQLKSDIEAFMGTQIDENLQKGNKKEIEDFLSELAKNVVEKFTDEEKDNGFEVKRIFNELKKDQIRKTIITRKVRPDGRRLDEIRPIEVEVGLLPGAHGSALFTRGETQSLGVITLGTSVDAQIQDGLDERTTKDYYFHYNFPPFSVGETGFLGRVGRREHGHGALAERALKPVLPRDETFPYTVRIVSEILESNGSSSMASVCSGSLGLMDCGVPITSQVSGIAMGLLIDKEGYVVLSDIQGLEDHYGDMDFKVAGTKKGITALQLDIKVPGLSDDILRNALNQAKEGRLHILDKMNAALDTPRQSVADNAPRIETIMIDPEKVGLVIGPGGKMIRKIEEESGAQVTIGDGQPGEVTISSKNTDSLEKAKSTIINLTRDVEVGDEYQGKIVKTTNFGAFVELSPGKEGLLHISTLSDKRVERVEDVVQVGQSLKVKVKEIDAQRRISLVPVWN